MRFSLLLSVYKQEKPDHLNQALLSIWDEQDLKPNQIVLVKDGPLSTGLDCVIASWSNRLGEALKVVALAENVGLGAALNEGLKSCKYDLVARMDADDISLPDRFEKQIAFLGKNTHIDVLSAFVEEYDEDLRALQGVRRLPLDHSSISRFGKSRNPISHPVAVFRKEAVLGVGGYPPFRKSQDYALWSKMLVSGCQMANLEDVLLRMRLGEGLQSRRGWSYLKEEIKILRYQLKIGFISRAQFLMNLLIRSLVRLSPSPMKSLLYKFAR